LYSSTNIKREKELLNDLKKQYESEFDIEDEEKII
jgi:hypothetical protein